MPGAPLACTSWRPTQRCPRAEEKEGEGERETERGEGQTKSFRHRGEMHTSLCFHLSAWWTFSLTIWPGKDIFSLFIRNLYVEINDSRKSPPDMGLLMSFNTSGLGWRGVTTFCLRFSAQFLLSCYILPFLNWASIRGVTNMSHLKVDQTFKWTLRWIKKRLIQL